MEKRKEVIELEAGAGGEKSSRLISEIRKNFKDGHKWKNIEDDGAVFDFAGLSLRGVRRGRRGNLIEDGSGKGLPRSFQSLAMTDLKLVFTTDAFIVDPIFFPGGDIGKIAMCGTINDLSVMGAVPIGISLSLVIEEGFPISDLKKIMQSIGKISRITGVPIVTGDTKVTERGKLDKIEITTSGIGLAKNVISNGGAKAGDVVIASGNLGEHAVALLAKRFNYKTKIKSDCQPLTKEIQSVAKYLTSCKDPTRGGAAAVLNEIAKKSKIKIILEEKKLPFAKETVALSELLGIDKFSFPSEGRFVATVAKKDAEKTIKILRKFNKQAKIIGRVERGKGVHLETNLGGTKQIDVPRGKLIPRIC